MSLTYDRNPRKHIWTFAGAADETSSNPTFKCPSLHKSTQSCPHRRFTFQASLAMTFSVIPVSVTYTVVTAEVSTQTIPFGMGTDVAQATHAALFQIYAPKVRRGLSSICHYPPLIM